MPRRNHRKEKQIARERITDLLNQADEVFTEEGEGKELANRYVELARKIAMKYKVRISSEMQRKFCKHCYSYLRPGVNCRVRTTDGKVTYSCLECNKFMRYSFVKERKEKRSI